MAKGLNKDQIFDLLVKERQRLDQESLELWEAGEKEARKAAEPALAALFDLINDQIINKLAKSSVVKLYLDQRLLNSREVSEQLLPTLNREFPGFQWTIEEDPEVLCCQALQPSLSHRIRQRVKKIRDDLRRSTDAS
jgi:hypothetical protein